MRYLYLLFMLMVMFTSTGYANVVKIKGKILSNVCAVSVPDALIDMKSVSVKELQARSRGQFIPFTIHLINCGSDVSGVSVELQGERDNANTDLLKVPQSINGATGVAIAFYDDKQRVLPLFSQSDIFPLVANINEKKLPLQVRYETNGDVLKPGRADSTATLILHYN